MGARTAASSMRRTASTSSTRAGRRNPRPARRSARTRLARVEPALQVGARLPRSHASIASSERRRALAAEDACLDCRAFAACGAFADALESKRLYGVWGGRLRGLESLQITDEEEEEELASPRLPPQRGRGAPRSSSGTRRRARPGTAPRGRSRTASRARRCGLDATRRGPPSIGGPHVRRCQSGG